MNQQEMLEGFLEELLTAADLDPFNPIEEFSTDLKSAILTFLVGFVDYLEQNQIDFVREQPYQFGRLCYTTLGKRPRITSFDLMGQPNINIALNRYADSPYRFRELHQHLWDYGNGIDLGFTPGIGILSPQPREQLYLEFFYNRVNHA